MNLLNNPTICISVARKPGRFGITVHNAGYRALGLNFMYKTFAIDDIRKIAENNKAEILEELNIKELIFVEK